MPLLSLPTELHLLIFSHLSWPDHSRLVSVCSKFRSLILTSQALKSTWYSTISTGQGDKTSLHDIFARPGTSYIYTSSGFRIPLPQHDTCSQQLRLTSQSPLFDEPLFLPHPPGTKYPLWLEDIYLLGVPLCGGETFKIPWEQVPGCVVDEENGYRFVPLRSVLKFLETLVWPEPEIPPEEGMEYKFVFRCNMSFPWMVQLEEVIS